MNYLLYIEFSAENLQFYMWYRDYVKRFTNLSAKEKSLAPPVDTEKQDLEMTASPKSPRTPKIVSREVAVVLAGTDFETPGVKGDKNINPFDVAESPSEAVSVISPWDDDASTLRSPKRADYQALAASAYEAADIKVQPCQYCEAVTYNCSANFS